MNPLLAALPVLLAVVLLVLRRGPVVASAAACGAAVLIAALNRAFSPDALSQAGGYVGLVAEVLLILLFGMALARMLQAAGAIDLIAAGLRTAVPSALAGTALVVFGVVPFAESVTGFGIGVTVGVPILRALGHRPGRAALLGLMGLIGVPWGALGPGTAVAANLSGLPLRDVGVGSALFNVVPVAIAAVVTVVVCRGEGLRHIVGPVVVGAVVLFGGILAVNLLIGVPLAGVLGSLLVIVVLLGWFRMRGGTISLPAGLGRALTPYGVLVAGLLVAQFVAALLEEVAPEVVREAIAWPPVWLAVACGAALAALPRQTDVRSALPGAARAWFPVGVSTAAFMVMGWVMSVTGMSTDIGQAVAVLGIAPAPLLAVVGAILTGSNTGSNAMLAPTITSLAHASGTPVVWAISGSNAAASFATLAAPPRILMAAELASGGGNEPASDGESIDTGGLTRQALLAAGVACVVTVVVLMLV